MGSLTPDAASADLATTPAIDLAMPTVWTDFPAEPIIDTPAGLPPAPSSSPLLFGAAGATSGGPCLVEPESGALMPSNWLRPRLRFVPASGQNLFEIRVHAEHEANDLVVYTTARNWTLPADVWKKVAAHIVDEPISVTVRGAVWDGTALVGPPAASVPATFTVAPASASGAIIYWSSNTSMSLRANSVTDETSHELLRPSLLGSSCVGCHATTPDGAHTAFAQSADATNIGNTTIGMRSTDGRLTEPPWLSPSARLLLGRNGQEAPSFSRAHFATGDRRMLSILPIDKRAELIWTDLETPGLDKGVGWNILTRIGDLRMAASPAFSHDGTQVAYVSATQVTSGVIVTDGDLLVVPWGDGAGGEARAVPGAHDSAWNEFYPAWSPDDRMLAYARVPYGKGSWANTASEVFVVPSAGGAAVRLAANDAPVCSGRHSPGLSNSWPRFAPDPVNVGNRVYYWLTFSSKRTESQAAQVYVSAVVLDLGQEPPRLLTYPSLYLWAQPADASNHAPVWERAPSTLQ